jgi:hypothetical protein
LRWLDDKLSIVTDTPVESGKAIMEHFAPDILRIRPTHIVSMGRDESVQPEQGRPQYHSRKVEDLQ